MEQWKNETKKKTICLCFFGKECELLDWLNYLFECSCGYKCAEEAITKHECYWVSTYILNLLRTHAFVESKMSTIKEWHSYEGTNR